jgi:hypothetical protein
LARSSGERVEFIHGPVGAAGRAGLCEKPDGARQKNDKHAKAEIPSVVRRRRQVMDSPFVKRLSEPFQ